MKKEMRTEIEMATTPERIWALLTGFEGSPQWNPFIPRASGEVTAGARLEVTIKPFRAKGRTFRPIALRAEPNREQPWRGRLWLPGLFDGQHIFTIGPMGHNRVLFVQREIFTVLLISLFAGELDPKLRPSFEEMNQALKARAERASDE